MNPRILLLALALVAVPFAAGAVLPERERPVTESADGLLIKYRPGVTAQQVELHADSLGIEMIRDPGVRGGALGKLRIPRHQHEPWLRELKASGLVEYAEPNYRRFPHQRPSDPRYVDQWAMATLSMEQAWDLQTGSSTVRIAIIDDGVDSSHEDLVGNVIAGKCFGPDDFCGSEPDNGDPRSADDSHGTLVAGQAGAVGDNATGITGTAWVVELLPLRTDLTVEYIQQAIDYAIANGVHIINASYGGASFSQAEYDAVAAAGQAGILLVTSAGNSHTDNDKGMLSFPQAFDLDNVLTVAASDRLDQLTSWAQYGQTTVDVAVGGEGILSTNASVAGGGAYRSVSGSSFASPMVAGIAALIRAASGNTAGYQEMKARIVAGAEMTTGLRGRVAGGRANAHRALVHDPAGLVPVIASIRVDDAALGNDNGALDAGETADLVVDVSSLMGAATSLQGTLTIEAGDAFVDLVDGTAGPVGVTEDSDASLPFRVTVPTSFTGNERVLFRLELAWTGGAVTRWFEHELGVLVPNSSQLIVIGRTRHDQYHAFHLDVPAGATDLRIDTATGNEYDVDLLVRHGAPPQYQINLGEGPDSDNGLFAYQPREEVELSGRFDGDETVVIDQPAAGTYHLVVVNYGLGHQTYGIGTSWCTADGCNCTAGACAGRVRFLQESFSGGATQEQAVVTVIRVQGVSGAATVDYETVTNPSELENAATPGLDFSVTRGTLTWADGDASAKSFTIQLPAGRTAGRNIRVRLSNPTGAALGDIRHGTVTIDASTAPPPPPTGGGGGGRSGGGSTPWSLVMLLGALALIRRRRHP